MARVKQTARKSVPPGPPRKQLIVKTIGRNRRFPGWAVRLASFQHRGEDQSSETEEEEEQEWYVGWRGSDYGEREPWDHPEASWEAHHRRRDEENYAEEMEHTFDDWFGVPLRMDGNEPLYDPRDPDPDSEGYEKNWRPYNEIQRLLELCGIDGRAARRNFQDFLDDHHEGEYNLDYDGRWGRTLTQSFLDLPESVSRNRLLWILRHCQDRRGGLLN